MREKVGRLIGGVAAGVGLALMPLGLRLMGYPIGNGCDCWPTWWFCLIWTCEDMVAFLVR